MIHLAFNEYTLCGKDIDTLRPNDVLKILKSVNDDLLKFRKNADACRFCLNELDEEISLRLQKNKKAEIDTAVI